MLRAKFVAVLAGALSVVSATAGQDVFEDDEIRITIPVGWQRATGIHPSIEPYRVDGADVVGNSALQADKLLLLQKERYTLALAYRTSHAGPGRFIEAFDIPWLSPDQAGTCCLYLSSVARSTGGALSFRSIIFNPRDAQIRSECGSLRMRPGGPRWWLGGPRWYGGYFTFNGSYFFDETGSVCQSKLYSLTTAAKTPAELPLLNNPQLEQIIREAIDIVNSIQYKRCAPTG